MIGALPEVECGWEDIQKHSANKGLRDATRVTESVPLKDTSAGCWIGWAEQKCLGGLPNRDPPCGKVVLYGRESLGRGVVMRGSRALRERSQEKAAREPPVPSARAR